MERMLRALLLTLLLPALTAADRLPSAESGERGPTAVRPWYVPDHLKLQFAGAIGFLSAGAGYDWWKERAESDVMLGVVPAFEGGEAIVSATLKQTFRPFSVKLGGRYSTRPIGLGVYLNYSFGSDYSLLQPEHYPAHYYPWSTALRVGAFLGGEIGAELSRKTPSRLDLYYELGTVDLEFVALLANPGYLGLFDVLNLGLGLKLSL